MIIWEAMEFCIAYIDLCQCLKVFKISRNRIHVGSSCVEWAAVKNKIFFLENHMQSRNIDIVCLQNTSGGIKKLNWISGNQKFVFLRVFWRFTPITRYWCKLVEHDIQTIQIDMHIRQITTQRIVRYIKCTYWQFFEARRYGSVQVILMKPQWTNLWINTRDSIKATIIIWRPICGVIPIVAVCATVQFF